MDHGSDSLLFRLYSLERVQVEVDVPGRSVPIETSFLGASKGNPPDIRGQDRNSVPSRRGTSSDTYDGA